MLGITSPYLRPTMTIGHTEPCSVDHIVRVENIQLCHSRAGGFDLTEVIEGFADDREGLKHLLVDGFLAAVFASRRLPLLRVSNSGTILFKQRRCHHIEKFNNLK